MTIAIEEIHMRVAERLWWHISNPVPDRRKASLSVQSKLQCAPLALPLRMFWKY
jgi:hypothetical protein